MSNRPKLQTISFWITLLIRPALFGLSIWTYCAIVSASTNHNRSDYCSSHSLSTWTTGSEPQSFRGCESRVESQQSSLFTEDVYGKQFARVVIVTNNATWSPIFDEDIFLSIRNNRTLCYRGFRGNRDLYGLGVRTGIYLQWVASLLSNNLLPESRKEVRKVYLIFNISICAATFVLSFTGTSIFSIEIEILYWMYWGGYMCVFVSSPS